MSRLQELSTLDRVIEAAIAHNGIALMPSETATVAKHLVRLMARDRQKAEQTRRAKIRRAG